MARIGISPWVPGQRVAWPAEACAVLRAQDRVILEAVVGEPIHSFAFRSLGLHLRDGERLVKCAQGHEKEHRACNPEYPEPHPRAPAHRPTSTRPTSLDALWSQNNIFTPPFCGSRPA